MLSSVRSFSYLVCDLPIWSCRYSHIDENWEKFKDIFFLSINLKICRIYEFWFSECFVKLTSGEEIWLLKVIWVVASDFQCNILANQLSVWIFKRSAVVAGWYLLSFSTEMIHLSDSGYSSDHGTFFPTVTVVGT